METLFKMIKKYIEGLTAGKFFTYYLATILLLSSLIPVNWFISIGIFVAIISLSYKRFVIYVPTVKAYVLHNKLSGGIRSAPPKWNLRLPWEEINQKVSLKLVSKEHSETYNSNDGIDMPTKFGFEYQPDPNRIANYISIDNSVIERGLRGAISSCLSQIIADNPAEYNRTNVTKISKKLLKAYEDITVQDLPDSIREILDIEEYEDNDVEKASGIEQIFGVNVRLIQVENIEYPEKFREAKMAKAIASENSEAAEIYQGKGEEGSDNHVSRKDSFNLVFLGQDSNTKKEIWDIEGLENFGDNLGKSIGAGIANALKNSNKK